LGKPPTDLRKTCEKHVKIKETPWKNLEYNHSHPCAGGASSGSAPPTPGMQPLSDQWLAAVSRWLPGTCHTKLDQKQLGIEPSNKWLICRLIF
jgi:hypothetical protein